MKPHRRWNVYDEMDRLRRCTELQVLLVHYRDRAAPDRQAWQDRVETLDGVDARDLARLHGELIAYGWLEQNTGQTPAVRLGQALACYRITPAGIRALKQLKEELVEA